MAEPKYVAETLAWCNAQRKGKGLRPLKKLPKGRRNDAASCPCGEATGLVVYLGDYVEPGLAPALHGNPLPSPVRVFVFAFDRGELPQYDIEAAA